MDSLLASEASFALGLSSHCRLEMWGIFTRVCKAIRSRVRCDTESNVLDFGSSRKPGACLPECRPRLNSFRHGGTASYVSLPPTPRRLLLARWAGPRVAANEKGHKAATREPTCERDERTGSHRLSVTFMSMNQYAQVRALSALP